MRIESSVTSISWIPSEAVPGVTRIPFDTGVMHYDDPPPDEWTDLDSVLGPEGARFANDLRAWVEVEDGRITGVRASRKRADIQYPDPAGRNAGPGGGGRLPGPAAGAGGRRGLRPIHPDRRGKTRHDHPPAG